MYELIQVGAKTYYINCPAKMGIYKINDTDVCLIDSGNDKDAAKKVIKIIDSNNWKLQMIINTHSHADHIGGNNLLQQRTGCKIFSTGVDVAFIRHPILEPSYLYGGYPYKEIRNKFLLAQPSAVQELTEDSLPNGMTMLRIDGHSFSMTALKTEDEIWFLADCLTDEKVIEKYHISFLHDVNAYLETLKMVKELPGKLFIPAHAEPAKDIAELADINQNKVYEIIEALKEICLNPICFEDILKAIFDRYNLKMDFNQHVLVGSTIRSYLAYLKDLGEISITFVDNKLFWSVKKKD